MLFVLREQLQFHVKELSLQNYQAQIHYFEPFYETLVEYKYPWCPDKAAGFKICLSTYTPLIHPLMYVAGPLSPWSRRFGDVILQSHCQLQVYRLLTMLWRVCLRELMVDAVVLLSNKYTLLRTGNEPGNLYL